MYRTIVTARLLDEAALRQNRMGRAPFVVPAEGHEACQVGTAWAMRRGTDVWLPYYRDGALVLAAGMTPYEVFLGIFAKADDPSSGGRQMPSHWGREDLQIISGSSPIATQVPHAAGIAWAIKYRQEDAVVGCWFGDGATSEGDWHEGLNFAGITSCRSSSYARTTGTRSACGNDADGHRGRRRACGGVWLPRRGRGRQRRARVLWRHEACP